jgi:phosphate transport system protein
VPAPATPHTSKGYDEALESARDLVLQMGARVSRQLEDALECLSSGSAQLIDQVMRHESAINELERSIDALVGQTIARHQPAAGDLRLLIALVKVTTDLERIGDEAKKIALQARRIGWEGRSRPHRQAPIRRMARITLDMLQRALAALERLDAQGAVEVMRQDEEVNEMFRTILRQLITYMIEDPRTISTCLDVAFISKSLERVGDHATNIFEHAVYAAEGKDVRHAPLGEVERALGS